MASEITFFENTLSKLKATVSQLKKCRDAVVKDFISDKITMVS